MNQAKQPDEREMLQLVRNALLFAGNEMGADGDHWPVIKNTVHDLMQDYERVQIERNVHDELRKYFEGMIAQLELNMANAPEIAKPIIAKAIDELREVYDATFTEVDLSKAPINEDEIPVHLQRAKAIIQTLEADDE